MNNFMGDLVARQLPDPRFWEIYESFTYRVGDPNGKAFVKIPRGFVTDFASVPRGLWNLFPPASGRYSKGAVVHDLLYKRGWIEVDQHRRFITRADADQIFREAMEVAGCNWFTRHAIYAAVRLGGGATWKRYREADNEAPVEKAG